MPDKLPMSRDDVRQLNDLIDKGKNVGAALTSAEERGIDVSPILEHILIINPQSFTFSVAAQGLIYYATPNYPITLRRDTLTHAASEGAFAKAEEEAYR